MLRSAVTRAVPVRLPIPNPPRHYPATLPPKIAPPPRPRFRHPRHPGIPPLSPTSRPSARPTPARSRHRQRGFGVGLGRDLPMLWIVEPPMLGDACQESHNRLHTGVSVRALEQCRGMRIKSSGDGCREHSFGRISARSFLHCAPPLPLLYQSLRIRRIQSDDQRCRRPDPVDGKA